MSRPCDLAGPSPDISVPDLVKGLLQVFPESLDFGSYCNVGLTDGTHWQALASLVLATVSPSMRMKPKHVTAAIVLYFKEKPAANTVLTLLLLSSGGPSLP